MGLRLEDKQAMVTEVQAVAQTAHSVVAAEYRGLTVSQLTGLRAKARTAGVWTAMHDELFHPFISLGGGHSRFSFDRIEDEALEHDYGDDVPF